MESSNEQKMIHVCYVLLIGVLSLMLFIGVACGQSTKDQPYDADIKGGLLLGFMGYAGAAIDATKLVFGKAEAKSYQYNCQRFTCSRSQLQAHRL